MMDHITALPNFVFTKEMTEEIELYDSIGTEVFLPVTVLRESTWWVRMRK
ncbi:hypothetical protein KAR91_44625 [Candidatus Pacearchaeota archaeon]|nr:hypothetical protein [Candidatus Pacearchaeota archaeon]